MTGQVKSIFVSDQTTIDNRIHSPGGGPMCGGGMPGGGIPGGGTEKSGIPTPLGAELLLGVVDAVDEDVMCGCAGGYSPSLENTQILFTKLVGNIGIAQSSEAKILLLSFFFFKKIPS